MTQIPGSPAYGLATADPPRDRGRPWTALRLAALASLRAYVARVARTAPTQASPSARSR
jgi:hypothetical protein